MSGGSSPLTYVSSGVDVRAGEAAVDRIRAAVDSTRTPGVLGGLGGFAGLFALNEASAAAQGDPVLLASTDGVGTKIAIATAMGRYDTIGIDLVAMCVDDLACAGGRGLFLLDYIAMEHLDQAIVSSVVDGIAVGCRQAGVALLGGEMAEHPGMMASSEIDVAGFAVGIAERSRLLGSHRVAPGDALIGVASPGLRSNGYSLARAALFERAGRALNEPCWEGAGHSLGEELLRPSVIYAPHLVRVAEEVKLKAAAHITGGGIAANLSRVVPSGCEAVVKGGTWWVPRIFGEIQNAGSIADEEMAATFNLGLGMVLVVPAEQAGLTMDLLSDLGAWSIGQVEATGRGARIEGSWH
ncbi:MAG: phosphoribosylformylglycinamidine cyclo-ligase [Actinomycetota bacterium]|nr:phosphoribosylformylglycinamidine cyclo-ligase [Actinomycetota bacterium]